MIGRMIKGAWRGAVASLAAGESGWEPVSSGADPLSSLGRVSKAGKTVSATSTLSISAAWACVRANSQLVGSLPVALYERMPDGSKERRDDDLAEILTASPGGGLTALEFWEAMTAHLMLQGNAYAEKLMIGRRLVGLVPLFGVTPKKRADGRFDYRIADRGRVETLPPEKVFHLRGFGAGDGLGMSAIKHGVQSLGTAIAADETAARVFQNGLTVSGVVESDQTLTPEQREQLQSMLDTYSSSDKAGKVLTLEAGLKFQSLQMNPEDAQLLESRRFNVEDVCRWFGTPPTVIGHAAQGQTMWGTGVEAIMLAWLTLGINPMLRRIEQRGARDLLPPGGRRGRLFLEWNREAMLQMDSKAKADFLSRMASSGTMTANERRAKLNLPKHDDPQADDLLAQTALAPLETLGKD